MPNAAPFAPKLEILPPAQRRLWDELRQAPHEFVLYGGTAVALHLGHRQSVDFDFFGDLEFDPDRLLNAIPFLAGAEIVQREQGALTVRVDRGGGVLVSFFAAPELGRIEAPLIAPGNGVRVAGLLDLAGTKADVVQKRAEAKDYVDLDAIARAGVGLDVALAAARAIQGPRFNPQITLKALSFFEDGNLRALPADLKRRLQDAVRQINIDQLPLLAAIDKPHGARSRS